MVHVEKEMPVELHRYMKKTNFNRHDHEIEHIFKADDDDDDDFQPSTPRDTHVGNHRHSPIVPSCPVDRNRLLCCHEHF
jgi:hypothetical protein